MQKGIARPLRNAEQETSDCAQDRGLTSFVGSEDHMKAVASIRAQLDDTVPKRAERLKV